MSMQVVFSRPLILHNTEHVLSFVFPVWINDNIPAIATYKYEENEDGTWSFGKHDAVKDFMSYSTCESLVFDDEGVFRSAGLFRDPNIIKLTGFAEAVKALGFDRYLL
jgi:hypothetical protein